MILSREDLRGHVKRREFAPVYVLFGTETYLRDLALKTICNRTFAEGDLRDFNETEFSLATDGNLTAALASAEQLPMMASRRVIRLVDVRVATSVMKDTLREADEKTLLSYLERPSESSVVIFVADEFDKRRKMAKVLIDHAAAVEFEELDDKELAKFAREELKKTGAEMDDRALRLLVSLVGPDLRRLTIEIAKLATAALPEKIITAELVETFVANSRETSNFDLTDHLLAGRKREALKVLKKILDDGGEPLALLGLIASNIRRMIMAKEAMMSGADRGEVARIAKMRYSDLEGFLATARRADEKSLVRATQRLAETDLAIKTSVGGSGPAGARLQIEMLVAELASL